MFMTIFTLCITVVKLSEGFQNPVVDSTEAFGGLSVVQSDDSYYMIALRDNNTYGLQSSSNLQSWSNPTTVFNNATKIPWLLPGAFMLHVPELLLLNKTYLIYFAYMIIPANVPGLAVASATDVFGPYTIDGTPLIMNEEILYSSALFVEGRKFLYYSRYNKTTYAADICARELSEDGLTFISEEHLILPAIESEKLNGSGATKPRATKIGDYFYLFFHREYDGIFVARSLSPLGLFERQGEVPFVSNGKRPSQLYSSVVMDTDSSHVFLYQCTEYSTKLQQNRFLVMAKHFTVESGWPVFTD